HWLRRLRVQTDHLFKGLGYNILDTSFSGLESFGLREKDKEFVKKIYSIANYEKRFQVFLVELKHPSSEIIRELPLYFEREIQYPLFVITHNYKDYTFVLVEKIRVGAGVWKRKLIKLNFDRENAYHTDKLVISNMSLIKPEIEKDKADPGIIYKILQEAMSVKKISDLFFNDYKTIFFEIRNFIKDKNINIKQAHEFSLQLLNRIMLIYFIDKKRWLKNSPKFMKWFWSRYLEEKNLSRTQVREGRDDFYTKWLKVLFLEAFNKPVPCLPQYLPQDVRDALDCAPYLNGGLFKRNELDELSINLPDEFIDKTLKFFEKYNFTIREDLPLDVEVAIDPQMLGYVYESLANISEEIYEMQDLGTFYTPKIEVDFMCRIALVEYLSKKLEKIPKNLIYNFVFNENNEETKKYFNKTNLWSKIEDTLDEIAVLDPACGSGAFLVGMLKVLAELYRAIYLHLNHQKTDYELKKKIIGNSLYGVDVMPWAVHLAELRFWLSLIIKSDLTLSDLKLYPLLPNLNLKLRVGDSLVQEIGGINLNLRDVYLSPPIKQKLTELKCEKEKYYNNDQTAKFKTESAILQEELRIFYEIIDDKIDTLNKQKSQILNKQESQIGESKKTQELFDKNVLRKFADIDTEEKKFCEKMEKTNKEIYQINDEIKKLKELKSELKLKLKHTEHRPFIWDIDFVEIFSEKGGFDIVIGNPPYVRQEEIAPPNKLRNEITNEEKKEYKEKLLKSVQNQFSFVKNIDKKSDYYIYFYFHGLSLLNKNGTFCFITSNSWLDVGYGKNLQEFLLKYVPIVAIYDNQVKRSFEHADVNTIIALFNAPRTKSCFDSEIQNNLVKFVMFKKPFEEVINVENLLKIEKADTVLNTEDFRVYPKKQVELLEEGWEYPEEIPVEQQKIVGFSAGKYIGNKWGGKYLRAPDIYFTILEKGNKYNFLNYKDKIIIVEDITDVVED
ncbi:MAG: DNA methyltransferase, partial [Endomicrobiia bacterium]